MKDISSFKKYFDQIFEKNLAAEKTAISLVHLIDENWMNLSSSGEPVHDQPICHVMFMNGHSLFRATLLDAIGGHTTSVFPLLRASLESCLYAFIMSKNPEAFEIWSHRQRGPEEKSRCRNLFTANKALNELRGLDPNLANLLSELYESFIDHGAHPNFISIINNLEIDETKKVNRVRLNALDQSSSKGSIFACIELGRAVLYLSRHVLPKTCMRLNLETILKKEIDPLVQVDVFSS